MNPYVPTTPRKRLTRLSWLVFLVAAVRLVAQAQEPSIPLPLDDGTPLGKGHALLLDPASDPGNPAVFVGTRGGEGPSLLRLTPSTSWSEYFVETLPNPLISVNRWQYQKATH